MRKICYITGTRADFGLMQSTLHLIAAAPDLELSLIVTGMHLHEHYGNTVREIEAAGFFIEATVQVEAQATGAAMSKNIGQMLSAFTDALIDAKPDIVMLLGDRGEMLAGAIAAIHLNIPIVHIHGGERSGTVDEPVRHAISKLSHFHFVATADARARLIKMGENAEHIHVTGAPGLDGLSDLATMDRGALLSSVGFNPQHGFALMVYHPVLQEADLADTTVETILAALKSSGLQIIALKPNSDAGSDSIRQVLERHADDMDIRIFTHFPRQQFVSWMACADMLIGNSSAGIIEAASFGTPVINIGSRQNLRERNGNVIDIDVGADSSSIDRAIAAALQARQKSQYNIYGDGKSGPKILRLLQEINLNPSILSKFNAY